MSHKLEMKHEHVQLLDGMFKALGPLSELECKFQGPIPEERFSRILQYFRSSGLSEYIHEEQLDIFCNLEDTPENIRVSLKGKDAISGYCRTNTISVSLDKIDVIKKKRVTGIKSFLIDDLNFKVDMKDEVVLDTFAKEEILARLPNLDKGFRLKKRFSYIDKTIRFDFSLVKNSRNVKRFLCHKGYATSGLGTVSPSYEIEIEYINTPTQQQSAPKKRGRVAKAEVAEGAVDKLVKVMVTVKMLFDDEKYYVSKTAKDDALKNYIKLCFADAIDMSDVMATPKKFFAAPQPVTLERKNIVPPEVGIATIQKGYTVTEKADGERMLLYVNNDGMTYMMDTRLHMRHIGVKFNNLVNTLLDGEYITRDVFGNKVNMYGVFDIYFHNSHDVRSMPLIDQRLSLMKDIEKRFKNKFADDGDLTFFVKQFKYADGEEIFALSKGILESQTHFPYKIDGLIYTPAYLGAGAFYEKEHLARSTKTYGTWQNCFKYKPPEENTIDFLVRFEGLRVDENVLYQDMNLFVGFNPLHWGKIRPLDYIDGKIVRQNVYSMERFQPGDVVDDSASVMSVKIGTDKTARCLNGDVIIDNTIIECTWENDQWVPTRLRKDKTELFRKQGISGTANDKKVALSTWMTIREPITYTMITTGKDIPSYNPDDSDTYFFRSIPRDRLLSKSMMDFHNIIKNECLIQRYKGKSIFDIACGKAGDLNKWVKAGYEKIFGIDYKRDNIENASDGAYARSIDKTLKKQMWSHFLYLTLDGSMRFNDDYFKSIEDASEGKMARIAWGFEKPSSTSLREYYKFVKPNSFDVVSCQFAIHYFFENEKKLDNFIYNVTEHLAPGGYFIGTCLDANKIKATFKREGTQELKGVTNNATIWRIREINDREIEIFMESIGIRIKEYYVDFDMLVKKLARHGVKLAHEVRSFEQEFNSDTSTLTQTPSLSHILNSMSPAEKQYSFFNTYFVFQKA
jgi:SAM-dependent methyltransferase